MIGFIVDLIIKIIIYVVVIVMCLGILSYCFIAFSAVMVALGFRNFQKFVDIMRWDR